MIKFISGIILYFYILVFRPGVKSDFPCRVSPYFIFRLDKKKKNIVLGNAFIGRDVKISEGCKFFEDPILFGKVVVGKYTSINGPGTRIFATVNSINIGSYCSIASNVIIQEYNHDYNFISTYNFSPEIFGFKSNNINSKGNIEIEEDVWIGSNSVILSGVKIGRGSVVGAGSVVTKNIPPYSIAVGNPAVVIRKRFSEEVINYIESLKWWEWDEKKIKDNKHIFMEIPDMISLSNIKSE